MERKRERRYLVSVYMGGSPDSRVSKGGIWKTGGERRGGERSRDGFYYGGEEEGIEGYESQGQKCHLGKVKAWKMERFSSLEFHVCTVLLELTGNGPCVFSQTDVRLFFLVSLALSQGRETEERNEMK